MPPATKAPLQMLVRAQVADFGRLAGGIYMRSRSELHTDLDAVGDEAISNAVKAIALANEMAVKEQGRNAAIAFVPVLLDADGGKKMVRLTVCRPPTDGTSAASAISGGSSGSQKGVDRDSAKEEDFSRGGIYVPIDAKAAGKRGTNRRPSDAPGSAEAEPGVATPSALARTVLGEWLRFAAPALRGAMRAAAASRASGSPATAVVGAGAVAGRRRRPFLFTMGPPAVSRAVKALAFAREDLRQKQHLTGSPHFAVVPRFGIRNTRDKYTGLEKSTRFTALCLVHMD